MTRLPLIIAALVIVCTAAPAFAQWTQPLRTDRDAAEFCRYSAPHKAATGVADGENARRDEGYDTARRNRAQRPVVVWLGAKSGPVIGYDRITGTLEFSLYQPARFAESHAVQVSLGTLALETTEEEAHRLWARYEAGTAQLRLTLLPAAWSDYDRPLCREVADDLRVVDGEVLEAELVDEVGKRLVGFQTRLGHEVAMMREHRIRGYLDGGMPVVTISSLAPFPAGEATLDAVVAEQLKSSMRAAIYGCYLKGLTDNARLQGALVMKVSPNAAPPTILVDSLHDTKTSICALSRANEIVRQHERLADELTLKATLIFRLDESGSL